MRGLSSSSPASITESKYLELTQHENRVDDLTRVMLEMAQADCPVRHHFGPDLYVRELNMKAGTLAVGHKQKKPHLNIMVKGKVLMFGVDSKKEISAPIIFTGDEGRKVGYILEDTLWLNVYSTDETDIDTLEDMFLEKSEAWQEKNAKEYLAHDQERNDYRDFLLEYSLDESLVREQSENKEDQIDFEGTTGKPFSVRASPIEGSGVFSNFPIGEWCIIGPARIDGKRTPLGRYTNHSNTPNSKFISLDNGDILLQSIVDIYGCKGGDFGEEITVDYRESLKLLGVSK
jgi:hypothetical protein